MNSFAPMLIEPLKVVDYYLGEKNVSKAYKETLTNIRGALVEDASIYRVFALSKRCNVLDLLKLKLEEPQIKVMALLYDDYITKSGLRKSLVEKFLFCPACLTNIISIDVNTLDHFLPKEHYPSYYVLPDNLVPMCGDCNRVKSTTKPKSVRNMLPHPYFDEELLHSTWLKVIFEPKRPLVFDLAIDCTNEISKPRLELHLETFKRKNSYLLLLDSEFSSIEEHCKEEFEKGALNLTKYLRQQAKSSKGKEGENSFKLNSIQYILYKALAESEWFCNEYFQE